MSSYNIALNFEDGVTRFVECKAGEKVLDAAFRAKINLPMDCSDGVCGTCKCRAESGSYDLGDDYIEDALTDDEKGSGFVLTCQMVPESDCVIAVPASSTACKTEQSKFAAKITKVEQHNDAAVVLELDVVAGSPVFLAGQYVNIDVPGSGQHRSYSFSSAPGESKISFLIKKIPGGVMSTWLESAQPGNEVALTGPLGSFYLRTVERPLLFLAGGTGLAPFLSMLEVLARANSQQKVHLIYGVTRDLDLVQVETIEAYTGKLPNFTYSTVVADANSNHPRKGWVTQHMPAETLNDGEVDVYLCGPPPMVDAVRKHFERYRSEAGQYPLREVHPQRGTENRMNNHRFAGKVMVIPGAAQGICRSVALRAAAEGARVVLVDRADFVCEVAEEAKGAEAAGFVADLETYEGAASAMAFASRTFGGIDILVNGVGGAIRMRPFGEFEPAQIDAEIRRSLMPTLYACHAVLPHLLRRGGGTIVNVSSNATRGIRRVPYSAAKGGVNALTQSLAMEYAEQGIRVVAAAPGGTEAPPRRVPRNAAGDNEKEKVWMSEAVKQVTESAFFKRYGTVDEQVAPILFLGSDEASYITGAVLPVAGGDNG